MRPDLFVNVDAAPGASARSMVAVRTAHPMMLPSISAVPETFAVARDAGRHHSNLKDGVSAPEIR